MHTSFWEFEYLYPVRTLGITRSWVEREIERWWLKGIKFQLYKMNSRDPMYNMMTIVNKTILYIYNLLRGSQNGTYEELMKIQVPLKKLGPDIRAPGISRTYLYFRVTRATSSGSLRLGRRCAYWAHFKPSLVHILLFASLPSTVQQIFIVQSTVLRYGDKNSKPHNYSLCPHIVHSLTRAIDI